MNNLNMENIICNTLSTDAFIQVNKKLAFDIGLTGAVLFGELLSKFKYYRQHGMLTEDGWFFCTVEDLYLSTSVAKMTQFRTVKELEKRGILETKQRGIPQKRYFKINFESDYFKALLNSEESTNGLESNSIKMIPLEVSKWDDCRYQNDTSENIKMKHLYNKNKVIKTINKKNKIISTQKKSKEKTEQEKHAHKERDRELKEYFALNIWERYPEQHRVGEKLCLSKFKKAIKDGNTLEEVMQGFNTYLKVIEINKRKGAEQFIKRLDNWFASESWKNPNKYMQSPADKNINNQMNFNYPKRSVWG